MKATHRMQKHYFSACLLLASTSAISTEPLFDFMDIAPQQAASPYLVDANNQRPGFEVICSGRSLEIVSGENALDGNISANMKQGNYCHSASSINLGSSFSLEALIQPERISGTQGILAMPGRFSLDVVNGFLSLRLARQAGQADKYWTLRSDRPLPGANTAKVAASYDAVNNRACIFLNGEPVACEITSQFSIFNGDFNGTLYLGNSEDKSGVRWTTPFSGLLDNARLYRGRVSFSQNNYMQYRFDDPVQSAYSPGFHYYHGDDIGTVDMYCYSPDRSPTADMGYFRGDSLLTVPVGTGVCAMIPLALEESFTIAMSVEPQSNSAAVDRVIMEAHDNFSLLISANNALRFGVFDLAIGDYRFVTSQAQLAPDAQINYLNVQAIYDGDVSQVCLRVESVDIQGVAQATHTDCLNVNNSATPAMQEFIFIGQKPFSTLSEPVSSFFDLDEDDYLELKPFIGAIHQLSVYNAALYHAID